MSTERDSEQSLDTKIMRGSAFAVIGFGGTNLLSLVTTIVLARLLTPRDFGLVALTIAILAFTHLVQESGLGAALVVHQGNMRQAAASAALFSPVVGVALYGVCFLAAPFLADIFDEPRLTDVFRVAALILPLRGLTIVPLALVQREMRFGPLTVVELGSGVAQAATAVAFAVSGAGVWSLVYGQLAAGLGQLVLAWAMSPLRPSPRDARLRVLRKLMRYGRHVGAANIIDYGNASAEGLIVGGQLGTSALGNFSLASRLAGMPVQALGNILGRGVFAALARLQDDISASRRIWLDNVQRLALVAIPATIGVVLVAEPIVLSLVGGKWRPAIVALQILALNGIVRTFSATAGEVFQAQRRPYLRVVFSAAHLMLLIPALIIGSRWRGIEGAAGAIVLVNAAVGLPVVAVVMRLLGVRLRDLVAAISRPAIGWILMTGGLLILRPLVDDYTPHVQLLILVAAAVTIYALAVAVLAREIVATMWTSLRGARSSERVSI